MPPRRRRARAPVEPLRLEEVEWTFGWGPDGDRLGRPMPEAELRAELEALRARYFEVREELLAAWRDAPPESCPWAVAVFEARGSAWRAACRRLGIAATEPPYPHPPKCPAEYDPTIPPARARELLRRRPAAETPSRPALSLVPSRSPGRVSSPLRPPGGAAERKDTP